MLGTPLLLLCQIIQHDISLCLCVVMLPVTAFTCHDKWKGMLSMRNWRFSGQGHIPVCWELFIDHVHNNTLLDVILKSGYYRWGCSVSHYSHGRSPLFLAVATPKLSWWWLEKCPLAWVDWILNSLLHVYVCWQCTVCPGLSLLWFFQRDAHTEMTQSGLYC